MPIDKAGVVGAGFMGAEIAYCLGNSFQGDLVIYDVQEAVLSQAEKLINKLLNKNVEKGKLSSEDAENYKKKLTFTSNLEVLRGANLVIEAVYEDMQVKQQVFRQLEKICDSDAILASNTSGLSITEIASGLNNPERVVGTHFFSPASIMRLVEIVRGLQTSSETIEKTRQICSAMGKESIVVKDVPGFLTTRIASALWLEAIRCLEEGVATAEDIDKGIKLGFNHAMGPLETADFVGLDLCHHVFKHLADEYGERFRAPVTVGRMAAAGWKGRKKGKGFHDYNRA